ncbi:hypothetical protein [Candidatus Vidania fulgoroideorum]
MNIKKKYIFSYLKILNYLNNKNSNILIKFKNKKIIIFFKDNSNKFIYFRKNNNFYDICNNYFLISYNSIKNLINSIDFNDCLFFEKKNNKLIIKSRDFVFYTKNIFKKFSVDFLKKQSIKKFIKIKKEKFLDALKSNLPTLKILGNEELGLNIIIKNKKLIIFSTDNFRVSYKCINLLKNYKQIKLNISKKIVLFLINLINYSDKKYLFFNYFNNKFHVIIDNYYYTTKECGEINLDHKIIKRPKKFKKAKILHSIFYKSIKRINSLVNDNNNCADFFFNKKYLLLKFKNNNEFIKERISINYDSYKKITIRLNIKFILDFLNLKKSKFIFIYFVNNKKKIIFKYLDKNYKYLLMPVLY